LSLQRQGEQPEALVSFRRMLEIQPDHAPSHYNIGNALKEQGEFEDAIASYQKALAIWSPPESEFEVLWVGRAEDAIQQCLAWLNWETVLDGERLPNTMHEFDAAVQVGMGKAERYHDVIALTEAVLAGPPELIDAIAPISYYRAACTAALLADRAEAESSAAERTRVRGLARTWLARAVGIWCDKLDEKDGLRAARRKRLTQALADEVFTSVRGAALESLPEAERTAWQELWAAIEDALK